MSEPFRKRWGLFPNPEVARTSAALDARQDCQRIVRLMGQYDMAWDMQRALELALFYTYGSDSVSTLLNRTGEFREHGQKRYDDTRLLIGHFLEAGWDSEEGAQALDRINRTHAHYRIPNDDYLFVLWTFIEFPLRWSQVYARRPMTAHEREAGFNFWVEIGRRMGLSDIPPTKAAFDAFIEGYKQCHFKPCAASAQVAQDTLRVGQAWLPWPLKGLVAPVVYSLFDDDALFLAAVGARKPPRWFAALVRGGLRAHGWLRRGTRLGAYPLRLADTPNRTYPGNRYSIEQLKPVHLQRVEGEAPSGTPGDAEAAVAPAGRCPFA
jgi:hypothetical protein